MAVVVPGVVHAAAPHRGFGERLGTEIGSAIVGIHTAVFVADHRQHRVVHALESAVIHQQILGVDVIDRLLGKEILFAGGKGQQGEHGSE